MFSSDGGEGTAHSTVPVTVNATATATATVTTGRGSGLDQAQQAPISAKDRDLGSERPSYRRHRTENVAATSQCVVHMTYRASTLQGLFLEY